MTPNEAAEMLGVSRDFFDEHVKPALRIIRPGRKIILIPVVELSRLGRDERGALVRLIPPSYDRPLKEA